MKCFSVCFFAVMFFVYKNITAKPSRLFMFLYMLLYLSEDLLLNFGKISTESRLRFWIKHGADFEYSSSNYCRDLFCWVYTEDEE